LFNAGDWLPENRKAGTSPIQVNRLVFAEFGNKIPKPEDIGSISLAAGSAS